MKLLGGKWSRGDILALIGVLAAVLAIPGMPKLFHWDIQGHHYPVPTSSNPNHTQTSPERVVRVRDVSSGQVNFGCDQTLQVETPPILFGNNPKDIEARAVWLNTDNVKLQSQAVVQIENPTDHRITGVKAVGPISGRDSQAILGVKNCAGGGHGELTLHVSWTEEGPDRNGTPIQPDVADIVKKDCQKLVDGQLLFEPSKTMRQGQPYSVFARLARTPSGNGPTGSPAVNIAEGLEGSNFTVVAERVSCKVAMSLDSEESAAFKIDKVPVDRKDEQLLEVGKFSQWDWRVTPRKNGPLHLLLYVTPMLYVDGIGEGLKEFKQPARIITVTPDYLYEFTQFFSDNWAIISGVLSLIVIPLFLWFRKEILEWIEERFKKKPKPIGFQPEESEQKEQVGITDKNRE